MSQKHFCVDLEVKKSTAELPQPPATIIPEILPKNNIFKQFEPCKTYSYFKFNVIRNQKAEN